MAKEQLRKRLKTLFSQMEQLSTNPLVETREFRVELEKLRARLEAIESEIAKGEKKAPIAKPRATPAKDSKRVEAKSRAPSARGKKQVEEKPRLLPARRKKQVEAGPRLPSTRSREQIETQVTGQATPQPPQIMFEKEWIGYAFSEENLQPLHEPTRVDVGHAVPIIASGQPIGRMQVKPPPERKWTQEEETLLNAVAQQASLQIQNLRLLSATEQARAEAEAATRRFIHQNWEAYLDAIHHSERVGYAYDQSSVTPLTEPPQNDQGIQEGINVMDEHVGTLFLQPDPSRPFTGEDKAMISTIASRIAQQVENIRLLADASRARAEAEEATRRLTREGWQAYTSRSETALGFVYDSNQVTPLDDSSLKHPTTLDLPLTVRGEAIGKLAVANVEISPEAAKLASSIAERVSTHLETLRLAEELQKRAAELQTVARVSTTASTALDPDELLQSVVNLTKERFNLYHASVYLANETWQTLLLAAGAGEVGRRMVEEQHTIPMNAKRSIIARASRERQVCISNEVKKDPDYLYHPLLPDTRSEMSIPMIVGDKLLGVFDVQSTQPDRFTDEDANIYTTLTSQVGVALQNARLYAEQSATVIQLRELDRLKSSFLANMSHELRTPLNSILGFADVIIEGLDGPLTENMTTDLKLIQKNGQHLLHLINDVLDMAKIEAGRMNLNPEHFVLHELINEVTSITSSLASERNVSLFIQEDSDTGLEVTADRTRIRQVMLNLVNNAIKFTERGKISLHVKREADAALITVTDTGTGIPPEQLEEIFQEFTQVDSSATRKVGGTGLGLPISRRLIEMHGGRLWAESTGIPGEGATFFVELPLESAITEPEKVDQ